MDTALPQTSALPRGPSFPVMAQGFPPQMVPGPMRPPFHAMPLMAPEISHKNNEFNRGIYVSGFERTLTAAMLQQHFKIKPINGLKLPLNKHTENKGFAFIYYQSPEDAQFVKDKLDHSVILRNKIRVTKTVVAENLSKMMFKLKTKDMTPEEVNEVKARYFNEKTLESEVSKIIESIGDSFKKSVDVNKIIIPHSKLNAKQTLNYARGFFCISNINEASRIVRQLSSSTEDGSVKKSYELVLKFIVDRLNANTDFSRYVKAEIYEYANKNKSNVIHIKNIKARHDEDPAKIAEELKALIQNERKQANITGCFVAMYGKDSAWSNVIFSTFEEALEAYEHFKTNKVTFRDNLIYANLRNYKDLRTVVVSTVKKGVENDQIKGFFNKLAERSPKVDPNDESKGRKYDYASFNIIQSKKYFHVDSEKPSVGLNEEQKPEEHWRETNTVPRRVVIHFTNEISDKNIKQLVVDIKNTEGWDSIFFEKDSKSSVTANHQKGHIEDGKYIRHIENRKKPEAQPRENKPRGPPQGGRRPMDGQQQFTHNNRGGQPRQNIPRNVGNRGGMAVPPTSRQGPSIPQRPMGQIGSIPTMGGFNPKMGSVPTPVMGGMQVPQMGGSKPISGMPMMGMPPMGMPTMGGSMPPMGAPIGGSMPPPMGGNMPTMGGNMPPMGNMQPKMGSTPMMPPMGMKMGGSIPPNMAPPAEKKQ